MLTFIHVNVRYGWEGTNVEALDGVMFDVMVGRVRTLRHSVQSCLTLWLGGYER